MSGIRTHAAAMMLGISPNTLRSWERRYGFPAPLRSPGGHRQYALQEIDSLRQTLAETHNISSAIALARERGGGPSSPERLRQAFTDFDEPEADRLLEESLMLRSLERTVEELLLEAVEKLLGPGPRGPEYEFAWRHATGWLSAMKRLSPPASRAEGVLLLDEAVPCELDSLHVQALELVLRRAGLRTLTLSPLIDVTRLGYAVRALKPAVLLLSGRSVPLDSLGRLVYGVRRLAGEVAVFDLRGAVPHSGASTVARLPAGPVAARDAVLAALGGRELVPTAEPGCAPGRAA